jgi:hypothetical protein
MLPMKSLFLFFFIFSFSFAFAQQDSVFVQFEITDKQYKEGIQNVNVTLTYGSKSSLKSSNSKGKFNCYLPNNSLLTYQFTHPLFESLSGTKKIALKSIADTVRIAVEMEANKGKILQTVDIKAPGVPDTVFESKRLSVADFELLENGNLVLLAYPKQLKKGSELLLYDGIDVLNTFSVPGTAEELVRDYRGNPHVLCKENVYGLYIENSKIGIGTIEKDYYFKYLAPIVDTNYSKMFFTNFSKDYPAFNYFAFDQMDSTYSKIIEIKDELMMELYRSEYKWVDIRTKLWAKNKELETGIDAEIWVGANYFTQSPYYKELYAPMFLKNDTVIVFDYYKDKMFFFDAAGNKLDSISIYHHYQPKTTGWKKQLIQDRFTGEVYALFDKAGYSYLGQIDLKTGEIKEKVRLEFRYIEKIAIQNNFVYYIYRPFESTQKKFLYKERLPYSYDQSDVPYGNETSIETGK